jgi:hypothetical protein
LEIEGGKLDMKVGIIDNIKLSLDSVLDSFKIDIKNINVVTYAI